MNKGLLIIALSLIWIQSGAQYLGDYQMIQNPEGNGFDCYGWSISISGRYAIVGSPNHNNKEGAAYVYEMDNQGTWNQVQKLVAYDKSDNDEFGRGVAIEGDYILVGAPTRQPANIDSGMIVYAFKRDNGGVWNEIQSIEYMVFESEYGGAFGLNIEISDNYAIISSWGAAFIYKLDTTIESWTLTDSLVASDADLYKDNFGYSTDDFGHAVGMVGDYAVVSTPDQNNEEGAAYIYKRDGNGKWNEVQKVVYPIPNSWGFAPQFGQSVGVDKGVVIVGAPKGNTSRGIAFIFKEDAGGVWNFEKEIIASDETGWSGSFGESVTIFNGMAYVKGGNSSNGGDKVYVFDEGASETWNEIQQVQVVGGVQHGFEIRADSNSVIISDGYSGGCLGRAYIYNADGTNSVLEYTQETSLLVYPNPASEHLIVKSEGSEIFDIEIMGMMGNTVYKDYKLKGVSRMDISEFPNGIYFVRISSNGKVNTEKLVIQK